MIVLSTWIYLFTIVIDLISMAFVVQGTESDSHEGPYCVVDFTLELKSFRTMATFIWRWEHFVSYLNGNIHYLACINHGSFLYHDKLLRMAYSGWFLVCL